jgi:hypothetical protein
MCPPGSWHWVPIVKSELFQPDTSAIVVGDGLHDGREDRHSTVAAIARSPECSHHSDVRKLMMAMKNANRLARCRSCGTAHTEVLGASHRSRTQIRCLRASSPEPRTSPTWYVSCSCHVPVPLKRTRTRLQF